MPRFFHLVFDLDGTLADTREDLAAATNFVLNRLGLPPLPPQDIHAFVGHGARVLLGRALGKARAHLLDPGVTLFLDYYRQHLLDHTLPYPGIVELLQEIKGQGRVLSVLTNKPEGLSRRLLKGLGLAGYFSAVVGGDTFGERKPGPQGLYYLSNLTRISLQETLLIGDSSVDVETGRAAGVVVCGVRWGFDWEGLCQDPPEFFVATPKQLLELLGS